MLWRSFLSGVEAGVKFVVRDVARAGPQRLDFWLWALVDTDTFEANGICS